METLSPSPPSLYICLNKEYYSNKEYTKYNNSNSIVGIVSEEVLDFIRNSEFDPVIKWKVIFFMTMMRIKVNSGDDKKSVMNRNHGWVHLKSKFLQNLFGTRDWSQVLEICIRKKFIERDEWFIPGNFSMSYRLNPEHKKRVAIRYFGSGKAFNTLIKKLKEIPRKGVIDEANPFEVKVSNFFSKILSKISISNGYENVIDSLPPKKQVSYNLSCDKIINKDYDIRINRSNGRWSNSVTNFPKILRKRLTYNGERLIELDFANMQPWMAIQLYPYDCPEKQKYLELVQSAEFYDFFARKTNHDISTEKKRKSFKKRILREIYFGGLDKIQFYKNWHVFCDLFPILSKIILEHRRKGNKSFAKLLQRKESLIMIDGALNEMIDKNIPCLTIHDAALCLPRDHFAVLSIMEKHFMRYIPHKPTIKF